MLDETEAILRFVADELGRGTLRQPDGAVLPVGAGRPGRQYAEIDRHLYREEYEHALASPRPRPPARRAQPWRAPRAGRGSVAFVASPQDISDILAAKARAIVSLDDALLRCIDRAGEGAWCLAERLPQRDRAARSGPLRRPRQHPTARAALARLDESFAAGTSCPKKASASATACSTAPGSTRSRGVRSPVPAHAAHQVVHCAGRVTGPEALERGDEAFNHLFVQLGRRRRPAGSSRARVCTRRELRGQLEGHAHTGRMAGDVRPLDADLAHERVTVRGLPRKLTGPSTLVAGRIARHGGSGGAGTRGTPAL